MKLTEDIIKGIKSDPRNYAVKIPIKKLVSILTILSESYYNKDKDDNSIIVSDVIFDELHDVLVERDPKNKFLKQIGAPIKLDRVPVTLPFPMGSLTKVKPEKENQYCSLKHPGFSVSIQKKQKSIECEIDYTDMQAGN